jgi:hypothetical protein
VSLAHAKEALIESMVPSSAALRAFTKRPQAEKWFGRLDAGRSSICQRARSHPGVCRNSGITSLVVNQDGVGYEKNMGKDTAAIASRMKVFNPDASWKRR